MAEYASPATLMPHVPNHHAYPHELKPGDWLEDLGAWRQIDSVDTIGRGPRVLHIVHFKPAPGIATTARCFSRETDPIPIWRQQ